MPRVQTADALLGLLLPFWQLVIAGFVLVAVLLSLRRLRGRGSSRMVRALLVVGLAIVGLAAIGLVADSCSRSAGSVPPARAESPPAHAGASRGASGPPRP